jgi:predicted XRE-type DNA-binding protein
MIEEIWNDIPNYEGLYQASTYGRIKSLDTIDRFGRLHKGRVRKLSEDKDGYKFVTLHKNLKRKKFLVHRLVALTFILNPENKPCINHKDGIRDNNYIDNLEWATYKENEQHKLRFLTKGKNLKNRGENNGNSELTNVEVMEIKSLLKDSKLTQQQIADKYNISRINVCRINTGKRWRYII